MQEFEFEFLDAEGQAVAFEYEDAEDLGAAIKRASGFAVPASAVSLTIRFSA